ncbi:MULTISPECIES: hypothetical protein [Streptomyces]|uniref:Uncharacterized protein n=1 Tax=Streptomyces qinglanensis TaxID=943816 RepID=A0A1E7K2F9_9ACTN|nr:hypothetical protein [Streptomyces qinglanensis]OEU98108.1 hypothetical protein AN217_10035 [Streptomyces qinglanensis]
MTARDPDEEEPHESRGASGSGGGSSLPPEEEAAWAAIVAAYGEEPAADTADGTSGSGNRGTDGDREEDREPDGDMLAKPRPAPDTEPPARSFTVYAAGTGPRDWQPAPAEDGADDEDGEGHFEPPEPPPLPETDTTTKFAWVAALGGPLLLIGAVLLQADLTWWIITLGVGGFLGGFATLVTRLRDGRDDDPDDPGRGAVV